MLFRSSELTVSCGGNISCWEPKFDDLTGGEVKSGPEAVNDAITITEDESIGDAGDDAQLNILTNDTDATLATVNGMAPGEELTVMTDGGVEVTVTVDADGNLSFDTNDLFDDLNDGDSDSFTLSYTVTGPDGGNADATVTVVINGSDDPITANDDCFVVFESEGAGEAGGEGNVLSNDAAPLNAGAVVEVNGAVGSVGEWITLASGAQFQLNADGQFDFDANRAYEELAAGESAYETLNYSVTGSDGSENRVTTTFNGPNGLTAEVDVTEVNGELVFNVSVLEEGGDIGDLRGLFFDVSDESILSGLMVSGDDVTGSKFSANRVYNLKHGANIKGSVLNEYGKFDGGVKIGTSGIGKDDIRSTTFTLTHLTESLSLDLLNMQDMGLRLTSVGSEGGYRDGSLKLGSVSSFEEAMTVTDSAEVKVEIVGENDDPDAVDDAFTVTEDAAPGVIGNIVLSVGGTVDGTDTDPDNDTLTVKNVMVNGDTFAAGEEFTVISSVLNVEAKVSVDAAGNLTFDDQGNFDALNTGEFDSITFNYTIQDGNGGEDEANVVVQIAGEDDAPPQTEYNILFLVDASSGLDDGDAHGLFLFNADQDLNGDGNVDTVLDAELSTVQQFVNALETIDGLGTDVEVGVQTFASNSNLRTPNDENVTLTDNAGNSVFTSGDDLSEAFAGAGGDDGVAIWNTAIRGANDFFEFNTSTPAGGNVVNLVYILSDSEGTTQTVFAEDRSLSDELADLQANHGAVIDTIIYNDTDTPNQFLTPIEASGGDGVINLVENQFDLNDQLANPLLDNLQIGRASCRERV